MKLETAPFKTSALNFTDETKYHCVIFPVWKPEIFVFISFGCPPFVGSQETALRQQFNADFWHSQMNERMTELYT
jgi:hypothetical protein